MTRQPWLTRARLRLAIVALFLVYGCHATYWVGAARPNVDEGFYALAAREVWRGRLPYRDFGYTQAPCFPYLQGVALGVAGHDQRAQRGVNALWGALTLALLLALSRRVQPGWAALTALALAATPGWVHFVVLGKTYALTGLLLLLTAGALTLRRPPARGLAFALFGALTVGCRLPTAVAVAALWASGLAVRPGRARRWLALAPPLVGLGLAAPFALADSEAFWFWNVGLHASVRLDHRAASLIELPGFLAPVLGLGVLTLVAAGRYRRPALRGAGGLLAAAGLGLSAQFLPGGAYTEYVTPLLPLLALGVARYGQRIRRRAWTWPASALLLLVPLAWPTPSVVAEPLRVQSFQEAGRYLRGEPSAQTVLTCYPVVTSGGGLTVFPNNLMGFHSLTDELPPEQAERLGLLSLDALTAAVSAQQPDLVVLCVDWPNFAISLPSCRRLSAARRAPLREALAAGYAPAWRNDHVVVLRRR